MKKFPQTPSKLFADLFLFVLVVTLYLMGEIVQDLFIHTRSWGPYPSDRLLRDLSLAASMAQMVYFSESVNNANFSL